MEMQKWIFTRSAMQVLVISSLSVVGLGASQAQTAKIDPLITKHKQEGGGPATFGEDHLGEEIGKSLRRWLGISIN